MFTQKIVLALSIALLPLSSFALFEARITYGLNGAKDALTEVCQGVCTGEVPGMVPLYGLGADAIVKLPVIPFGFGLRYEKLGLNATSSNMEGKADFTRTAILVNYRIIDTILHVGPIFSFGVVHNGSLSIKQNGGAILDYSSSTGESYSLGLEVGVKPLIIIPLAVGAEGGVTHIKMKNATDSQGHADKDFDLSGYYLKVFLGLDI